MFWGLVLDPGKRYTTTVDKSFHVSMAALDCSSVKNDTEILSVILECDGQENILCNLSKQQRLLQSHLDLNFMTGDKVCFEVKGNGKIHLSGYLVPDDEDDMLNSYSNDDSEDEEEEEDEEEDEEVVEQIKSPKKNDKQKGKRKLDVSIKESNRKKAKVEEDSDEDSDDDDEGLETVNLNSSLGAEVAADTDEEEDDDDDDDDTDEDEDFSDEDGDEEMFEESDEEESAVPQKEQPKTPQSNKKQQQTPSNKQTPKQQQQSGKKQTPAANTPLLNGSGPNQSGKKNKNKGQETPKGQNAQTPNQNSAKAKNQKTPSTENGTPQNKKTLDAGVVVRDIREGNGPLAKNGQMVAVYYQGRLKTNNKMFDECKKGGQPFKFRLGKGEVIKGWDVGVAGMKVGGIRSITCPAQAAYGQKGMPPQIPANSTLVFQVELKSVN